MSINLYIKKSRRFVQRWVIGMLCMCFIAFSLLTVPGEVYAAQTDAEGATSKVVRVFHEVMRQMSGVTSFAAQAINAVMSTTVRADQTEASIDTLPMPESLPITSTRFPLAGVGLGTLIINAPLSITNTLTATGESYFGSTSISQLLTARSIETDTLVADSLRAYGVAQLQSVNVSGSAEFEDMDVSGSADFTDVTVAGETTLTNLQVAQLSTLAQMLVTGPAEIAGMLAAYGGIETGGADVQLGTGSIYASNIVNEVLAGAGVIITGSSSAPLISFEGVTTVNGEIGDVEFDEGTDIDISSSLRISNRSTLSSVAGRGGCVNCITDTDVINALTIDGGTINATVIGSTTAASAFFTDVTIGTSSATTSRFVVQGTATSTFGSTINLDSGCFAIAGTCVISASAPTYVDLGDTPGALAASAIQYANASATALTQSSSFVFDGTNLGVGTSSPTAVLTVDGSTLLAGLVNVNGNLSLQNQQAVRWYDADSSNYVGFRASTTLSTDVLWTLPSSDGGGNEVLVTNGSGELRFEPVSAIGGGAVTYVDLTDTPSTLTVGAIPFVNASGTALIQSSAFRYDGSYFGIGVTAPAAELSVDGSVNFIADDGSTDFVFKSASKFLGVGTNNPTAKLSVSQGSILQVGGSASSQYSPTLLGSIALPDDGRAIALSGGYAYIVTEAAGDDFHVVDITNTANPIVVGSLALPARGNDIKIVGKYAYVTTSFTGDDFHVIDISDPSNPVEVYSINLPSTANGIAVQDDYAYVVTDGTTNNVQVIDISNPLAVTSVGSTSLPASAKDIAVFGDYAFAVTEVQGDDFHVIDVSDSTSPVQVDSLNLPDTANTVTISASGVYAYVGTNSSGADLHVITISNPLSVIESSSVELGVNVTDINLVGTLLYVTSLTSGQDLQVLDVATAGSPVLFGGVDLGSGNVFASAAAGRYIYTVSEGGIGVVDVTGAKLQSVLTQSLQAGDIFVTGGSNFAKGLSVQGVLYAGGSIESSAELKVYGDKTSYVLGGLSIGTTSSASALTVDGVIQSTNLLGGAVNITTDANGNIIRDPSDIRLKENIILIENALDSLMQLRGVRYEWRDKQRFGEQVEIGFIAQEVDLVLPEVVRKGGDYWSINTRNILAVVVEAVKEIWVQVQGTQAQVEQLQIQVTELEYLRDRVDNLESQLKDTDIEIYEVGADVSPVVEDPEPIEQETEPESDVVVETENVSDQSDLHEVLVEEVVVEEVNQDTEEIETISEETVLSEPEVVFE